MFTRFHFSFLFGCIGAVIGYFVAVSEFAQRPDMEQLIQQYETIGFVIGAGVGWLTYRKSFMNFTTHVWKVHVPLFFGYVLFILCCVSNLMMFRIRDSVESQFISIGLLVASLAVLFVAFIMQFSSAVVEISTVRKKPRPLKRPRPPRPLREEPARPMSERMAKFLQRDESEVMTDEPDPPSRMPFWVRGLSEGFRFTAPRSMELIREVLERIRRTVRGS